MDADKSTGRRIVSWGRRQGRTRTRVYQPLLFQNAIFLVQCARLPYQRWGFGAPHPLRSKYIGPRSGGGTANLTLFQDQHEAPLQREASLADTNLRSDRCANCSILAAGRIELEALVRLLVSEDRITLLLSELNSIWREKSHHQPPAKSRP
jgi:hypothetical protein